MAGTNDGGPAFPCDWDYINSNRAVANGMSLRDYFAAKAMQGSMAAITLELNGGPMPSGDAAELALLSYQLADAMLKARSA